MNKQREQVGQVEISFTYRRHQGSKFEHGSVKLRFDGLRPYSFSSSVKWQESENYERYVQARVEDALIEKYGTLDMIEVNLLEIEFDEIESTSHGFQSAAYAATCAAFLV